MVEASSRNITMNMPNIYWISSMHMNKNSALTYMHYQDGICLLYTSQTPKKLKVFNGEEYSRFARYYKLSADGYGNEVGAVPFVPKKNTNEGI